MVTVVENSEKTPKGLPASLAGFEDQASFSFILNEENLGEAQSTWRRDGSFEGHSIFSLAGQTVQTTVTIVPDYDGRWIEFVNRSQLGVRTSVREGISVTSAFKSDSREQTTIYETPLGAVLFDNDAPALISQALRLYDHDKGGAQKFPALIGGEPPVELTLDVKEKTGRNFDGRDIALTRYLYGIPGFDLYAWADETGKIYLVEIPAQKAAFVRDGFESLLKAKDEDPLLSAPAYEVLVDRSVGIPMRDGVELSTDIYRPAGLESAPVILMRIPYKKEGWTEPYAKFYARRGYVFAAQDCRGCFSSSGVWEPFVNEGKDGYDAIEWLARQPYSNGKVGMIGASYAGWAQWWAAVQHPPHLVAMIPNVSPPDPFYNAPYEYGVFALLAMIWWAEVVESQAGADISCAVLLKTFEKKYTKLLRALPVIELDKAALGKEIPYWRKWIEHPTNDSYWEPVNFLDKLGDVNLPVFHQSGWFDDDGIGAKLNYLKMASHGHSYQKLTLGPWGHTDTATRAIGDRDFGENAIIDLQRDYLRWFDRWLKGIDNGIEREPLVSVFVMGANKWLRGATYPLETTQYQKLFLTSGGHANTSHGDGKLSFDPPAADTPPDRYTYDPGDPTPDFRFYEESEEDEKKTRSADERKKEAEEYQRKIAEQRDDILVYETDPLTQPLTFAGPISAVIYASSSALDTDWFVTLSEIGQDEKIFRLAQGKIRARFRRSMKAPELLEPNRIYQYAIDLWHTGISIPTGARLRVEIASASFPRFSRNLNTGGHNETETNYVAAQQAIYHDLQRQSYILLPIIPEE
jgi:uncharacterized protein